MKIDLLGCGPLPGAAHPCPRPGCRCVSCLSAAGDPRRPAAALVGGRLLLDTLTLPTAQPGPVPPTIGTRADGEQDVPAVGERRTLCGLRVEALPAGDPEGRPLQDTVVLLVTDEPGRTLLWAPCTGPLPQSTLDALHDLHLDLLALDVLGACAPPHGAPHPSPCLTSLAPAAHQLARLRAVGAVDTHTEVIALGLGHGLPPSTALAEALAPWRVAVVRDGTLLDLSGACPPVAHPPRRTLVLGPAGSGKSAYAEHLLAAEPAVGYVATGPAPDPTDEEWVTKVRAHRDRRPPWWSTTETTDLVDALAQASHPLMIDSLSTWLTAAMETCGAWSQEDGWAQRLDDAVTALAEAWRTVEAPLVAVSDEVGWGVVPDSLAGRTFRHWCGTLNQRIAAESERVVLVVAGRAVDLPA